MTNYDKTTWLGEIVALSDVILPGQGVYNALCIGGCLLCRRTRRDPWGDGLAGHLGLMILILVGQFCPLACVR